MPRRDVRSIAREITVRVAQAGVETVGPEGTKAVTLLAYTGGIVDVGNGPEVFDLAGMEIVQDLPLLVDHDDARVAGYATSAEVVAWADPSDPKAQALPALLQKGLLMVDEDEPEGRRVAKRLARGFPQQASVRIEVEKKDEELVPAGESRQINGRTLVGPFLHDKRSRHRETSFVSLGADANTRAALAQKARKAGEAPMLGDDVTDETPTEGTEGNEDEGKVDAEAGAVEAKAATIDELDAAFPDHPRFALDHAKKGSTLAQAQAEFNKVIAAEAKEAKAALAAATKKAGGTKVPAVRPAGEAPAPAGPQTTPLATFRAKVREACSKGEDRAAAVSRITRENPELHRQVLAQANPGKPAHTGR